MIQRSGWFTISSFFRCIGPPPRLDTPCRSEVDFQQAVPACRTFKFVLLVLSWLFFSLTGAAFAFEDIKFVREFTGILERPVDVAVSPTGDLYVVDQAARKVQVFDSDGKPKFDFGREASMGTSLDAPNSIAISSAGHIVVADTGNDRIGIFDGKGALLSHFGSSGLEPGRFNSPVAVAVDQFGFIYVADKKNRRVQSFTPDGIFLSAISLPVEPIDLAVDPERSLYILMPSVKQIWKVSPDGRPLKEIQGILDGRNFISDATGMTVDVRGDIYVSEDSHDSIKKVAPDGAILLSFGAHGEGRGSFERPLGMQVDNSGSLYVADSKNKRVQVFQISGAQKASLQGPAAPPYMIEFHSFVQAERSISDLYFRPGRGLYVLVREKNHVLRIGLPNRVFGQGGTGSGQFDAPTGLVVMGDGRMLVADTGNDRVQVLKEDGSVEQQFGKSGTKTGQFGHPAGVAVNSRGVRYVSDVQNSRVQIFNGDGMFLSTFGSLSKSLPGNTPEHGKFQTPTALAVDSKDRIYVLDSGNSRIQVFDQDGKFLKAIGRKGQERGEFTDPADLAIDERDRLYVADRAQHRIQIFDSDGTFMLSFGAPARGGALTSLVDKMMGNTPRERGPGQFEGISAIAAAEGKIYVADSETDQVQVFQFRQASVSVPRPLPLEAESKPAPAKEQQKKSDEFILQ